MADNLAYLLSKDQQIKALYGHDVREFVKQRKQGGNDISYLEWHVVNRLLDQLTGGNWDGYVVGRELIADRMVVTYRIVVHCSDGDIVREATGGEEEDMKGYGDFMSNAEAMAFKRAAARLGLGLSLYAKDSDARRPQAQRPPVQAPPARAGNGHAQAAVPPAGDERDALLARFKATREDAIKAGFELTPIYGAQVRAMSDAEISTEIAAMRGMLDTLRAPA